MQIHVLYPQFNIFWVLVLYVFWKYHALINVLDYALLPSKLISQVSHCLGTVFLGGGCNLNILWYNFVSMYKTNIYIIILWFGKVNLIFFNHCLKISPIITEISKVLTARLGIQNAQSHLINRFQNSLKSRGQKS